MNYEKHDRGRLWTSWFKYLRHLVISRPSPALASATVRILSGSELADGLTLAPGLPRRLSHRRQMFGRRSGNGGERELGRSPVNAGVGGRYGSPALELKRTEPERAEHGEIDLDLMISDLGLFTEAWTWLLPSFLLCLLNTYCVPGLEAMGMQREIRQGPYSQTAQSSGRNWNIAGICLDKQIADYFWVWDGICVTCIWGPKMALTLNVGAICLSQRMAGQRKESVTNLVFGVRKR